VIYDVADARTSISDPASRVAVAVAPSGAMSSDRAAKSGTVTGARTASRAPECCHPCPVDEVTRAAHEAILERDWEGLRALLHPYLHWTAADGTRLRGRTKVMARLRAAAPAAELAAVEVRDGQIYRWQEPAKGPRAASMKPPMSRAECVGDRQLAAVK
jgi:hypothetical protein